MAEAVVLPGKVKVSIEPTLVQQAVVAEAANARAPHGHTKIRGEVRGGGRKPWRQKGTGRARASSIRSPLWVGGGITFGPRPNRNFKRRLNQKMRTRAWAMVLAQKIASGTVLVAEDSEFEVMKTAEARKVFKTVPNLGRRPLVILDSQPSDARGFRNLFGVRLTTAASVTATEILAASSIIASRSGLEAVYCRAFGIGNKEAGSES